MSSGGLQQQGIPSILTVNNNHTRAHGTTAGITAHMPYNGMPGAHCVCSFLEDVSTGCEHAAAQQADTSAIKT